MLDHADRPAPHPATLSRPCRSSWRTRDLSAVKDTDDEWASDRFEMCVWLFILEMKVICQERLR